MSDTTPCWATRRDVDPRYDPGSDAWNPEPCSHPECLADQCGIHDWDCVAVACLYDQMDAVCDLADGHGGAHAFTGGDIVLVFPESPVLVPA